MSEIEEMNDDEIEAWLTFRFGSLDNAYNALDEGTIGINGKNNLGQFTAREIEILQLAQMNQLIKKML